MRREPPQEYGQDHPWESFNLWHKIDHDIRKVEWPCTMPLRCLWRYTRKTDAFLTQKGVGTKNPYICS